MAQISGVKSAQVGYPIEGIESDIGKILMAKGRKEPNISDLTRVNEEDLYATIFYRELRSKSSKAADEFIKELPEAISKLLETKGIVLVYKAADRIARDLVRRGEIAQDLYRELKKRALGLSQLDGDKTWLNTKRSEEATGVDTPLRSLKTAKVSISANAELSEDQYALFRKREAEISRVKWKERVIGE